MAYLSSRKRQAFAQFIALGWPPASAAHSAGFKTLAAAPVATMAAEPAVRARVAELTAPKVDVEAKPKTNAARPDEAEGPVEHEVERPPLPPIMSEEEWMTEFAPHLLEKWRASQ